jgi:erythronate-4-phosphate dehydrogenase
VACAAASSYTCHVAVRIVVDENVPLALEAFGRLGDVVRVPGRSIVADTVRDATALVVRSITRVDAALLSGSAVRFVGTATIGTDHVDRDFLVRAGIEFACAPGSNARSVAEYVTAALLELEIELGRSWSGRTLGVVGVGNVGRLVVEQARALGMAVLECDPPRARSEGSAGFVELAELLAAADAVTLHTPLVAEGPDATRRLVAGRELARLHPGAALINTSRGEVVDGDALRQALAVRHVAAAVLDVWEGEPEPDPELVRRVAIATPHVAGYSLDGKIAGTRMVAEALARFLGAPPPPAAVFESPEGVQRIEIARGGREGVREAVRRAVGLRDDDRRMRALLDLPPGARGAGFDRLRRDYPVRREFGRHAIAAGGAAPEDRRLLSRLGFRLV